jgi:hypothetical protein
LGAGAAVEIAAFCTGLATAATGVDPEPEVSVPPAASADPCCVVADARIASKARKIAPPNN